MISARDLFWFGAGLLSALAAGFVLTPLLPTSLAWRARLRGAAAPLVGTALLVGIGLGLYLWHGSPNQLGSGASSAASAPSAAAMKAGGSGAGSTAAGSIDAVLLQLEQRLAKQGGSDADWELLAQTYDFLGRKGDAANARTQHQVAANPTAAGAGATPVGPAAAPPAAIAPPASTAVTTMAAATPSPQIRQLLSRADSARRARDYRAAAQAYERLAALDAMNAQSWADYADVAASLNGGRLAGAPERYIDSALALDPANEKALWLKASAQHEGKHYRDALQSWQTVLKLTPAGSADARIFAANLAEDEALASGAAASSGAAVPSGAAVSSVGSGASATVAAAAIGPAAASSGPAQVSGEVAVADALRNQVPAGLTLFIVAKSIDSPGPPVAVVRTQTGQWPQKFLLDDSLAMLPDRTLSKAGRVSVQARVSHSGTASAQSGDFQSIATTVDPREHKALRVVIDRVIE